MAKACSEHCLKAKKCWQGPGEGSFPPATDTTKSDGACFSFKRSTDGQPGSFSPHQLVSPDSELMLGTKKHHKKRHLTPCFEAEMTKWNIYTKLFQSRQLLKILIKIMHTVITLEPTCEHRIKRKQC